MTQDNTKKLPKPPALMKNPRQVTEMFEALADPRVRMSEEKFRTKYLPFVSTVPVPPEVISEMCQRLSKVRGGAAVTVKDLRANIISEWIKDIGKNTPYIECDIVDNAGNVLFTVPPLATNKINVLDPRLPLHRAIEHAENEATVLHELGEKVLQETLLPAIVKHDTKLDMIDQWNKIYAYYDLPLIETNKKAENSESEQLKSNNEDVTSDPNDYY